MKKKTKKIIGAIIGVFLGFAIAFGVCVAFLVKDYIEATENFQQQIWFRFGSDIESFENTENFIDVEKTEIDNYKPKNEYYNNYVYYDKLSDNEKTVYKAFEYAFDKGYKYTFVTDELMENSEYTASDILTIYTLDNTVLQQNILFDNYTYDAAFVSTEEILPVTKSCTGFIVGADNFSPERTEKLNKAIEKLEKVDFGFTENSTEYEKVTEIFKYVQENVKYEDSGLKAESYGDVDYLYDAVFKGLTNCDGYATMFGTLCSINGIDCFDKSHTSEESATEETDESTDDKNDTDNLKEEETEDADIGHTWNVVSIDGKWYNVDVTESEDSESDNVFVRIKTTLCFEDKLQSDTMDFSELVPKCNDNLIPLAGYYNSFDDEGITDDICNALSESDETLTVFAIKNYTDGDENEVLQNTANRLYIDIYISTIETKDYTLFCVYKQ